jgi:hypothetical protein
VEEVGGEARLPRGLGIPRSVDPLVRLGLEEQRLALGGPPRGDLVQLARAPEIILTDGQEPGQDHPGLAV